MRDLLTRLQQGSGNRATELQTDHPEHVDRGSPSLAGGGPRPTRRLRGCASRCHWSRPALNWRRWSRSPRGDHSLLRSRGQGVRGWANEPHVAEYQRNHQPDRDDNESEDVVLRAEAAHDAVSERQDAAEQETIRESGRSPQNREAAPNMRMPAIAATAETLRL